MLEESLSHIHKGEINMLMKLYIGGEFAFYYNGEKYPYKGDNISIDAWKYTGKYIVHNVDEVTEISVIGDMYTAREVILVYVEHDSPPKKESELD